MLIPTMGCRAWLFSALLGIEIPGAQGLGKVPHHELHHSQERNRRETARMGDLLPARRSIFDLIARKLYAVRAPGFHEAARGRYKRRKRLRAWSPQVDL